MKNKLTQADINEVIRNSEITFRTEFGKVTIAECKLPNGFVIVESSGAVDASNYDFEIGKESAMKRIEDQVWKFEGYALANRLMEKGFYDEI